ncbi:hypothetical protein D187_001852 [Cystobacter fuscus DSM 2262]|uniref:N-acetyltransferase domain-containing protein n=1 Tax=Cystobacter fuscus (strain ATCC 25194 / DSM 2262 / NBRC 100088 / M29) TaxID=1242864 RepID=S9P7C8_CYSF2|nr:GNAT family N-acetyltransferase [Cystobacter fuscus]EPX60365.1 hypothetical protein D187_001852 [Cystobacter fuscus DSM 2262]
MNGAHEPESDAFPTVRRAQPEDCPAILELMRSVYGDYNPYFDELDAWLADEVGQLGVAVLDDKVVGFGKLTCLAPGEWWIESIAVDKAYRRRGVARTLGFYGLSLWHERGSGSLRALIAGYNDPSFSYGEAFQFHRSARYVHLLASPEGTTHGFRPLTAADRDWAHERLTRSALWQHTAGLVECRWKWQSLTPEFLSKLIDAGEAFAWRGGEGVACMWRRRGVKEPELRVWFAGAPGNLGEMAREFRAFAATQLRDFGPEPSVIHWRVPDVPELIPTLEASGFRKRESFENTFYLVEYQK